MGCHNCGCQRCRDMWKAQPLPYRPTQYPLPKKKFGPFYPEIPRKVPPMTEARVRAIIREELEDALYKFCFRGEPKA